MGASDIFEQLGEFMQGLSVGMLQRHAKEQAAQQEFQRKLNQYNQLSQYAEENVPEDQRKGFLSFFGIRPESSVDSLIDELRAQRMQQTLEGTTPSQKLAGERFNFEKEKTEDEKGRRKKSSAEKALETELKGLEKQESDLLKDIEAQYGKPPSAGSVFKQKQYQRNVLDDPGYQQKQETLQQIRQQQQETRTRLQNLQAGLPGQQSTSASPQPQSDDDLVNEAWKQVNK